MVPVWLQARIPLRSSDWVTISAAPGVQLSDAWIFPVTETSSDDSHEIVIAAGGVTTGAFVSMIVNTCMQVVELPHASVAVHVRYRLPV